MKFKKKSLADSKVLIYKTLKYLLFFERQKARQTSRQLVKKNHLIKCDQKNSTNKKNVSLGIIIFRPICINLYLQVRGKMQKNLKNFTKFSKTKKIALTSQSIYKINRKLNSLV